MHHLLTTADMCLHCIFCMQIRLFSCCTKNTFISKPDYFLHHIRCTFAKNPHLFPIVCHQHDQILILSHCRTLKDLQCWSVFASLLQDICHICLLLQIKVQRNKFPLKVSSTKFLDKEIWVGRSADKTKGPIRHSLYSQLPEKLMGIHYQAL